MKKLFTLLFTAALVFSLTMPAFAQETTGAAAPKAAKKVTKETKETKKAKKQAEKQKKEAEKKAKEGTK